MQARPFAMGNQAGNLSMIEAGAESIRDRGRAIKGLPPGGRGHHGPSGALGAGTRTYDV
jgi:hypothetical protein